MMDFVVGLRIAIAQAIKCLFQTDDDITLLIYRLGIIQIDRYLIFCMFSRQIKNCYNFCDFIGFSLNLGGYLAV